MSPKKSKPEISIEWLDVTIDIKVCGADIAAEDRGFVRLYPELDPKLLCRDQIDRNRLLFRKKREKLQKFEYKLVPTNPTKEEKPKVLPKLTCNHCGKSFSRRSTLEQHIASHNSHNSSWEDVQDAALQDIEQSIVFGGSSSVLNQGIEELEIKGEADEEEEIPPPHGSSQEYRCPTCDKVYPKHSLLKKHMQTHSGVKPYSCSVCGWKFLQKYNLKKHMWSHSLEAPNRCVDCLTEFPDSASLRDHVQRYHDQEELELLENEMTVGVNPPELIPCPKCKRKFAAQAHLDRHMPVHNNMLKPYGCDICGWKFHLLHNMERHRATHAKGKKAKVPPHQRIKKKIKKKKPAVEGGAEGSVGAEVDDSVSAPLELSLETITERADEPVGKVKEFSNDFSDDDVDLGEYAFEEDALEAFPAFAGVMMPGMVMPMKKQRKKRELPKDKPFECEICGWKFHLQHNMERHRATHAKGKKAKIPPHIREQMKNEQNKKTAESGGGTPGASEKSATTTVKPDEPVGKVKEFSNEFSDEDLDPVDTTVEEEEEDLDGVPDELPEGGSDDLPQDVSEDIPEEEADSSPVKDTEETS